MATLKEMFPVQFFRGQDLKKTVELTIEEVSQQDYYGKKEWFVWFAEDDRGLRLSFKNAERLAIAAKSENNRDWIGLRVRLTPTPFTTRDGEPGTMIVLDVVPAPSENGGTALTKPKDKPPGKPDPDDDIPL